MLFRRTRNGEADRRLAPRRAAAHEAEIRLGGGRSVACSTLDVSHSGARLQVGEAGLLPGRFEIAIPALRIRHPARLVWRQDGVIGIQYVPG